MMKLEFENKVLIVGDDEASGILNKARRASHSDAGVLLCGQSGTGKELVARLIHSLGPRRKMPFVAVNCSALPEGMMEAELFGFEKGSFTGALYQRTGKFELASGGTLLLDEVTEMPLSLQAKLLRAIQEQEIDRLGGKDPIKVDVRIIATSNREPLELIEKGLFRSDLFYRLNILRIDCPVLNGRKQAIKALLDHFISLNKEKYERQNLKWSECAIKTLVNYHWPGNIRELANLVERATVLCEEPQVCEENIKEYLNQNRCFFPNSKDEIESLEEIEKRQIQSTLQKSNGNRTEAAKRLGISVRTLHNKIRQFKEAQ